MQSNESASEKPKFGIEFWEQLEREKQEKINKRESALAKISEIISEETLDYWYCYGAKPSNRAYPLSYDEANQILEYWEDLYYDDKLSYWKKWSLIYIEYLIDDAEKTIVGIYSNIPSTHYPAGSRALSIYPENWIDRDSDELLTFTEWCSNRVDFAEWTTHADWYLNTDVRDLSVFVEDRMRDLETHKSNQTHVASIVDSKLKADDRTSLKASDFRSWLFYLGYSDYMIKQNRDFIYHFENKFDLLRNGTLQQIGGIFWGYKDGQNTGAVHEALKKTQRSIQEGLKVDKLTLAERKLYFMKTKIQAFNEISSRWMIGHDTTIFTLDDMLKDALNLEEPFRQGLRYYEKKTKKRKFREVMEDQFLVNIRNYEIWFNSNQKQIQESGFYNNYASILGFLKGIGKEILGYLPKQSNTNELTELDKTDSDSSALINGKRQLNRQIRHREYTEFYCVKRTDSKLNKQAAVAATVKKYGIGDRTLDRAINANRHILDIYKCDY